MRTKIQLECADCKSRNYSSTKNRAKTPGRVEIKKFCKHCQKHTIHKETK